MSNFGRQQGGLTTGLTRALSRHCQPQEQSEMQAEPALDPSARSPNTMRDYSCLGAASLGCICPEDSPAIAASPEHVLPALESPGQPQDQKIERHFEPAVDPSLRSDVTATPHLLCPPSQVSPAPAITERQSSGGICVGSLEGRDQGC